jgi:hypothetical protein
VNYATLPHSGAAGMDIIDIAVIESAPNVAATFFKDTAYILDSSTATTSQPGDQLYVAGALKEKLDISDTITPGFCSLEFVMLVRTALIQPFARPMPNMQNRSSVRSLV